MVIVDGQQDWSWSDRTRPCSPFNHVETTAGTRTVTRARQAEGTAGTDPGCRIDQLVCNIELPEDAVLVRQVGAAGIGLYRTEFFIHEPHRPAR